MRLISFLSLFLGRFSFKYQIKTISLWKQDRFLEKGVSSSILCQESEVQEATRNPNVWSFSRLTFRNVLAVITYRISITFRYWNGLSKDRLSSRMNQVLTISRWYRKEQYLILRTDRIFLNPGMHIPIIIL